MQKSTSAERQVKESSNTPECFHDWFIAKRLILQDEIGTELLLSQLKNYQTLYLAGLHLQKMINVFKLN